MNSFNKLGRKNSADFFKLRKQFKGRIFRDEINFFKEKYFDTWEKLLAVQNKERPNNTRISGRLYAKNLYDFIYFNIDTKCIECGCQTKFTAEHGHYREFCSHQCLNKSSIVIQRRNETCNIKYGGEPNLHPNIKKKKIKTFRKKYGVDNPSKAEVVKKKKIKTFRKNYGADHWTKTIEGKQIVSNNNQKTKKQRALNLKKSLLKSYGVPHYSMTSEYKKKYKLTCMNRYGVPNAGCLPQFAFRRKEVTIRGKTHIVQGNEDKALTWLSNQNRVSKICTTGIPKIRYRFEGKLRTYIPDIMVKMKSGTTRVVEVKGSWPLKCSLEKILAKSSAAKRMCKQNGWEFWFFYYEDNGKLHKLKNPTPKQIRNLLEL